VCADKIYGSVNVYAYLFDREILPVFLFVPLVAGDIREDSLLTILYMTETMMFASVQEIRLSNVKDGVTAGIGRCIKRKSRSVKHVS